MIEIPVHTLIVTTNSNFITNQLPVIKSQYENVGITPILRLAETAKDLEAAVAFPIHAECIVMDEIAYNAAAKEIAIKFGYTVMHIKDEDFPVVTNLHEYASCFLSATGFRYVVIGDIHEHTGAFERLVAAQPGVIYSVAAATFDCVPVDDLTTHFILVGDYLNKGETQEETRKIVDFIYNNRQHFHIVRGNHEYAVWNHIKGLAPADPTRFTSIPVIESDCELCHRFEELYAQSKPFYIRDAARQGASGLSFIITHAPCEKHYLAKLDSESQLKQLVWKVDPATVCTFMEELSTSKPPAWRHMFGHVSFEKAWDNGWLVGLDSGAGYGNTLSCAIVSDSNVHIYPIGCTPDLCKNECDYYKLYKA